MVNKVMVPNFSQYNFEIGDTTEVVTKQNGVNAALEQFGNSLNTTIDQFNDDVEFVDTARQEVDADNIVHAPGSGLPNEAGTAYSRDMGTAGNQIRTNQQNDDRYYTRTQSDNRYYTQAQVDSMLASRLPAGLITMWSGAVNAIPSGWALCNGANGTPDLRNRFVVGAGSTYGVGDTGGANSVTLTTAQIPAHNHSASTGSNGSHSHSGTANTAGSHNHSGSANSAGAHSHTQRAESDGGISDRMRLAGGNGSVLNSGVSTASAGAHTHSLSINSNGSHTHSLSINNNGAHTHSVSVGNTGGGQSHENRPPYYALAYIMKL